MPERPDDFDETIDAQKSNLIGLKHRLVEMEKNFARTLTFYKIFKLLMGLLVVVIILYLIFK
ncbi:MAG: hypothetical protein P1P80_00710 [ANME-2 cluster archaeon]|nr:hypothetical protein [ANME-2 cluster archaeon]